MQEEKVSGKIFDQAVLKRLFKFIGPYKVKFFLLVFVILIGAILSPLMPLLIKYTIDTPITNGDYIGLSKMLMLMIGLLFASSLLAFFNTYLAGWLGQNITPIIKSSCKISPAIAAIPELNTLDKVSISEMVLVTKRPIGVSSKKRSFRLSILE